MKNNNNKTDNAVKNMKYVSFVICLFIGLLLIALGYLYSKYDEQQKVFSEVINNNRKVYVYSLEDVLIKLDALNDRQKFDESIIKLNEELIEGEKKIKSIKKAQLKADFSDVYLKNLRMKRDELVNDYQNSVKELTQKINQALADIAKEKKAPVVFVKSAIAVQTPYLVDLTEEVVNRVQKSANQN